MQQECKDFKEDYPAMKFEDAEMVWALTVLDLHV
jgi:hypothetical protein